MPSVIIYSDWVTDRLSDWHCDMTTRDELIYQWVHLKIIGYLKVLGGLGGSGWFSQCLNFEIFYFLESTPNFKKNPFNFKTVHQFKERIHSLVGTATRSLVRREISSDTWRHDMRVRNHSPMRTVVRSLFYWRFSPLMLCFSQGENHFTCGDCNKKLGMKTHLICHVKTVHEGEKPFSCGDCDRKFH